MSSTMSGSAALITDLQLTGDEYSPRWGSASASVDDKIYLFGGYVWYHGAEKFHDDFYEIDTRMMTIRLIMPVDAMGPCERFGHTLVTDTKRKSLLLFGGRSTHFCFNDLWSFSVADKRWTLLSAQSIDGPPADLRPHPSTRSWHTACYHNSHLYICGGLGKDGEVDGEIWRFDLEGRYWECLNSQLPSHGIGSLPTHDPHFPVREPAEMYWQQASSSPESSTGGHLYIQPPSEGLAVDVLVEGVSTKTLMERFSALGRTCHQSTIWRGGLYVYGGLISKNRLAAADLWRFDLDTFEFKIIQSRGLSPGRRVSPASCLCGDQWILHGGLKSYPGSEVSPTSDVYLFDFPTSTWHRKTELCLISSYPALNMNDAKIKVPRYGHCAATNSDLVPFFFGGADAYASAKFNLSWRIEFFPSTISVSRALESLNKDRENMSQANHRIQSVLDATMAANSKLQILEQDCSYWRTKCGDLAAQISKLQEQMDRLQREVKSYMGKSDGIMNVLGGLGESIMSIRGEAMKIEGHSA